MTITTQMVRSSEQRSAWVSIGLPVYRGAPHLREALESISAHTFTDFELIISDDASTDQTEQICREHVEKDKHIRYFRNQTNHGAAADYNRVFEVSRGEYIKWAAADDVCAPEFLARCLAALDQVSASILACTSVTQIDEQGRDVRSSVPLTKKTSVEPRVGFRRLIRWDHSCELVFGLIRSRILRQTNLIEKYSGSERILLSQLALSGPFTLQPEVLSIRRVHPGCSARVYPARRSRMVWFEPSAEGRLVFPIWRAFIESWCVIVESSLPRKERLLCYRAMVGWIRENRKWLVHDLLHYPKQWVKSHVPGAKPAWAWLKMIRAKIVGEG